MMQKLRISISYAVYEEISLLRKAFECFFERLLPLLHEFGILGTQRNEPLALMNPVTIRKHGFLKTPQRLAWAPAHPRKRVQLVLFPELQRDERNTARKSGCNDAMIAFGDHAGCPPNFTHHLFHHQRLMHRDCQCMGKLLCQPPLTRVIRLHGNNPDFRSCLLHLPEYPDEFFKDFACPPCGKPGNKHEQFFCSVYVTLVFE